MMNGQHRRLLMLGLLCGLAFSTLTAAVAQTTVNADLELWNIVRATPYGTELEVQLYDGTVKGKLLTASDTLLRLSCKNEIAELHRNNVVKVYQLSPKPDDLRRMMLNLGAITGVAAGLEIAKNKDAGLFLAPAIGGTLGALGGYTVGNRMKTRMLIYDAQPRQLRAHTRRLNLTSDNVSATSA